jgi:hypothetical protein
MYLQEKSPWLDLYVSIEIFRDLSISIDISISDSMRNIHRGISIQIYTSSYNISLYNAFFFLSQSIFHFLDNNVLY